MIDQKKKSLTNIMKLLDIVIVVTSFISAYYLKKYAHADSIPHLSTIPNYYLILTYAIISWYIGLSLTGLYETPLAKGNCRKLFLEIIKSCTLAIVLLSFVFYIFKITDVSRIFIALFFLVATVSLICERLFFYFFRHSTPLRRHLSTKIVIIGIPEQTLSIISTIKKNLDSSQQILGYFQVEKTVPNKIREKHTILGTLDDLDEYLLNTAVDELFFALPLHKVPNCEKHIIFAETLGITVRITPDWELRYLAHTPQLPQLELGLFNRLPVITFRSNPLGKSKFLIKTFLDYSLGLLITLALLPLFFMIGFCIKIFSRGPVFYSQERVGLNGRLFNVHKFRTMVQNADSQLEKLKTLNEADGPAFKIKKDPRIVPYIGSLLRKTSLDELPQLFNVLKGEMSLVGPRPPLPAEVSQYQLWQRRRLSMKPGMTCSWQICPKRNDLPFEEWMKLDLKYIDNWSLLTDINILLLTTKVIIAGHGR
ncbi:sugar transferase [Desulfotalea psychrophila]|uniref:Related to UDP-galactose-lipid carrier transferase n=1 Tax=Desulfotalea psychrophila (strain LSv54 / DSM 12343) TaxID=177439 RepID=Q6AI92_DESPS|nr:sugar transferase [Desulfotalea psychrophila]CAG37955.1 related to UDP-galactose-lipid carrier transferase [Desulfotalea psychrophila LSv54]